MSNNMLIKNSVEINGQSSTQEQITTLLAKLKALLELGLAGDLENYTSENLHGYLWVLSDLVERLEKVMA